MKIKYWEISNFNNDTIQMYNSGGVNFFFSMKQPTNCYHVNVNSKASHHPQHQTHFIKVDTFFFVNYKQVDH